MNLGARVNQRLTALNMSQSELARRSGVSQPTINALINRNKVGSIHLHRIARELLTTPAYLMAETDDPSVDADEKSLTREDREWLELVHALGPKERDALFLVARTMVNTAASPMLQSQSQSFAPFERK